MIRTKRPRKGLFSRLFGIFGASDDRGAPAEPPEVDHAEVEAPAELAAAETNPAKTQEVNIEDTGTERADSGRTDSAAGAAENQPMLDQARGAIEAEASSSGHELPPDDIEAPS